MRMFVAVDMGQPQPGANGLFDLGAQFDDDLFDLQPPRQHSSQNGAGRSQKLSAIIDQAADARSVGHWASLRDVDVQSDAERRAVFGQADGRVERGHVGHQRRAGYDAARMALDDRAIDACGQPEIIRVDDQSFCLMRRRFHVNEIATERTEGAEDIMISLCSLCPLWLTVFIHLTAGIKKLLPERQCAMWDWQWAAFLFPITRRGQEYQPDSDPEKHSDFADQRQSHAVIEIESGGFDERPG